MLRIVSDSNFYLRGISFEKRVANNTEITVLRGCTIPDDSRIDASQGHRGCNFVYGRLEYSRASEQCRPFTGEVERFFGLGTHGCCLWITDGIPRVVSMKICNIFNVQVRIFINDDYRALSGNGDSLVHNSLCLCNLGIAIIRSNIEVCILTYFKLREHGVRATILNANGCSVRRCVVRSDLINRVSQSGRAENR